MNDAKVPLELDINQYGTPEGIAENIKYALSLNLPEFQPAICVHDGTFVIVCSGPSVRDFVAEIREESKTRTICAVKGGYDFCVENGITPSMYLTVEPRRREVRFPQKESVFLLASRTCRENIDALSDYTRILWHAWGQEVENVHIKDHIAVGGGSTSGLRAISIGYILGFRKFRFYGLDSCLVNNEKRVGQGEIHNDVMTTDVIVGDRTFYATMAMAEQANEFQETYKFLPDANIEVMGDGLIAAIIAERKKEGMPV